MIGFVPKMNKFYLFEENDEMVLLCTCMTKSTLLSRTLNRFKFTSLNLINKSKHSHVYLFFVQYYASCILHVHKNVSN